MFTNSDSMALTPVSTPVRVLEADFGPERQATISELLPYFLVHLTHELRRSSETVDKYRDCMNWVLRIIGDITPGEIRSEHVLLIKARCAERKAGPSRIASIVAALKSFLRFSRLTLGLQTIDPSRIRAPRIPKREVLYLTAAEVRQFLEAIPLRKGTRSYDMKWLSFRALAEVLLGTGMRISEALSLMRSSVNFETGEASIIGKGNKERVVFFSPRAMNWIKEYLNRRTDDKEALFLDAWSHQLARSTAMAWFRRLRKASGLSKKVSPHILRHTVATTLLFNGCPIGHIKDILGHEYLMTTCKYYLGTDKRAAKTAHGRYLDYEPPRRPSAS